MPIWFLWYMFDDIDWSVWYDVMPVGVADAQVETLSIFFSLASFVLPVCVFVFLISVFVKRGRVFLRGY